MEIKLKTRVTLMTAYLNGNSRSEWADIQARTYEAAAAAVRSFGCGADDGGYVVTPDFTVDGDCCEGEVTVEVDDHSAGDINEDIKSRFISVLRGLGYDVVETAPTGRGNRHV